MKRLFYIAVSFLAPTICLQSCRKDDKTPCKGQQYFYYLSEQDKARIPYSGNDSLMFVSNSGDTSFCIGQGKKQFFRQYIYPNHTKVECTSPTSDNYEAYKYVFKDVNNHLNLEIIAWKNDGEMSDVVEVFVNNDRFYPMNMMYLAEKYYDDSVVTKKGVTPTVAANFSPEYIFQYNLKKGFVQFKLKDAVWTLNE